MSPQLNHVILGLDGRRGGARDALEDLAHITQVVGVVRFRGGWSETLLDHLVDIDRIGNNVVTHALDGLSVGGVLVLEEEPIHYIVEDVVHGLLRVGLNINHVEVADITRRDVVATTTWGSHGSHKLNGSNDSEFLLIGIDFVPATVIHPLTEELDGRLCSIHLLLRHVEIIDENEALLAKGRSIDTLSALFHLAIDD